MRIDPVIKPVKAKGDSDADVKYKRLAAIIFVFAGVFYFLFKVIFNL